MRDGVREILERQLAEVVSDDRANTIVRQALAGAAGISEAARRESAMAGPGSGVARIQRVVRARPARPRLAALLVETATQAMGTTEDGPAVAEAAYDVLGSGTHRIPPAAELGRSRLRAATLASLPGTASLEARAFLALSSLPHPGWLHALCEGAGALSASGLIWIVGVLGAYLLRIEGSVRALKLTPPIVAVTAFISEKPAKALFAPRRPFSHLLWMMLLGRKPRAESFPSGHAATALAAAWTLGSVWPRCRPVFLGLGTLVSLSRVYLGAHDPGEIVAGMLLGVGLAEVLRRPTEQLLAGIDVPPAPRLAGTARDGQIEGA